jgi:hypothetical protein
MNSIISDIALDLGPFALDLEFEGGKSNDWGLTHHTHLTFLWTSS